MNAAIVFGLIVAVALMRYRLFRLLASSLGGIASFFAMLASIISFEILAALGFLALAAFCLFVALVSTE